MNSESNDSAIVRRNSRHQSRPILLKSIVSACLMIGAVTLTACNNNAQDQAAASDKVAKTEDATSSDASDSTAPDEQANAKTSAGTVSASNASITNASNAPVRYNVAAWNNGSVDTINIDDLDKIQATFGKVVSTDKNSLDYASNPATKYRFMADDAAYLDIIDSQKYLELGWYYANPADSAGEKASSTAHAKKAYKFARQIMGDEGATIVADMLGGQTTRNKVVGGQKVELAKCEFYSCMLVLAKPSA